MSPSPAVVAPLLAKRLPIPRSALSALDQCRRPHPTEPLNALAATIIHAALTDGHSEASASLQYVTHRLLIGVSVSSGASRLNFSIVLVGLIRRLSAALGSVPVNQLISRLVDTYGQKGTFNLGYAGAERERALGALAAVSAVFVAVNTRSLSAAACRSLITLLRSSVEREAAKWRLGRAAAHIVGKALTAVKLDERGMIVTVLWRWCQERREKEDGLQIAFLLHSHSLIDIKAFEKLYPSLGDGFEQALMDTFEGGFSSLGSSANGDNKYVIPSVWRSAVRYIITSEGSEHLGSISHFWKSVVLGKLVRGSRSGEKKLLALELIPLVFAEVHDLESFNIVFESSLASMVAAILGSQKMGMTRAPLRKGRTSEEALAYLTNSAKSLGKRLVKAIFESEGTDRNGQPMLCEFLKWSVTGGIWNMLLPPALLAEVLASLSPADEKTLFSNIVREFAQPYRSQKSLDGGESKSRIHNRASLLRFLFTLARQRHSLAKDVVRVVALYSVFHAEQNRPVGPDLQPLMRLDNFQNRDLCVGYGTVLPQLLPDLPLDTAALAFRRLTDFLASQQRGDRTEDLLLFTVKLLSSASSSQGLSLNLRRTFGSAREEEEGETKSLEVQSTAVKVVERLSILSSTSESSGLSKSLKLIAAYLCIGLYDPLCREGKRSVTGIQDSTQELSGLFKTIDNLADHLTETAAEVPGENDSPSDGREDGENSLPTPTEYIAQLIADLCGRDGNRFRHVSVMAIEALDQKLDDSVVSVFFDAIDSYLSGKVVRVALHRPARDPESSVLDINKGEDEEMEERNSEDEKVRSEYDQGMDNVEPGTSQASASAESADEESDADTGSEEDSEDVVDVDIDIDREDPAVLADFDKRIGAHLRLLKEEKKEANQRRLQRESRFARAARVLDALEAIARKLRIRLEKTQEACGRLPIVFLDLHVRLYEFVLGDDKNFRFLKQVCRVVSKQMLIAAPVLVSHVSDKQTVLDIVDRFFKILRSCPTDRQIPALEARTISRSAGSLMNVASELSDGSYTSYLTAYEEILVSMMKPGSHFWIPDILGSFIQKAPLLSLKLSTIVAKTLQSRDAPKSTRQTASEVLLGLSVSALQLDDSSPEVDKFWKMVEACLLQQCTQQCTRHIGKQWSSEGYCNMIKVAANAIRAGRFDRDDVVSQLKASIETMALPQRERTRLLKSLRIPTVAHSLKRSIPVSTELRRDVQEKKRKTTAAE